MAGLLNMFSPNPGLLAGGPQQLPRVPWGQNPMVTMAGMSLMGGRTLGQGLQTMATNAPAGMAAKMGQQQFMLAQQEKAAAKAEEDARRARMNEAMLGWPGLTPAQQTMFRDNPELFAQYAVGTMTPGETFRAPTPEELTARGLKAEEAGRYQVSNKTGEWKGLSSTGTTINMPMETAYAKERGTGLAATANEYDKNAAKANSQLTTLDQMKQLSQDPKFYSGFGGNIVLAGKQILASIGGDPNIAKSAETFSALSNKLIYDRLGTLGNQISNGDRSFIERTIPNIGNTPAGISQMIDIYSALARRDIEVAEMAHVYESEHGQVDSGFQTELRRWAEAHPLFTGNGASPAVAPATTEPAPTAPPPSGVYDWTPEGLRPAQ